MREVLFACGDTAFEVTSLEGVEQLGSASRFDLELIAAAPVDPAELVGQAAALSLSGEQGARIVHGIVRRITAIATSQAPAARRYRVRMQSDLAALELGHQTRIFQHLSVPEIIRQVLEQAGLGDRFEAHLLADHAEREYLTQYAETDAAFVRRLCEDEGLYFRFVADDGFDRFVLEDRSPAAPEAAIDTVSLVDESAMRPTGPMAFRCTASRRRRTGKVTLRDYDPAHPALELEGSHRQGLDIEQSTELYRAPGGFHTPAQGAERARLRLESLRADAEVVEFRSNALRLAPGLRFELTPSADYPGTARPEGRFFVTRIEHRWSREGWTYQVTAIPEAVPFRLPCTSPRPQVSGIHTAFVTGAPGEEIHTDEAGHVKVRFVFDRFGPSDDQSSLPVRVLQPSLPGSMLIPRVGWEVVCAFEDGHPDRPYVLGRAYNAKHPPPVALPANKTMTSLSTISSPGGGAHNTVQLDDAAGRQHMSWNAGLHKTTTVGGDMLCQTVGFEQNTIDGSQTWSVGGSETVSVKNAWTVKVGSQTASVGGNQDLLINAAGSTKVGSETVTVGAALLEQVGSPASGLKAFAESAVLAGVGKIPMVGEALSKGYSVGKAVGEAYAKGGSDAALEALAQQGTGMVADKIPGGDALVAAADGAGLTPWSDKAKKKKGAEEAGGGTGGPGGAGAGGPQAAPGHRKTIVDGVMAEAIGAVCSVTTPGSIKWTTLGAASFAIGGGHSTTAVNVSSLTAGASSDTVAALSIKSAGFIGRTVKGAMSTTISGSLSSSASGKHDIKAGGPVVLNVGGALSAQGGAVVFNVGGSVVAVHGGGVLFKAAKVTVNGESVQSGKTNVG